MRPTDAVIDAAVAGLRSRRKDLGLEVTRFESGAFWVDVRKGERLFSLGFTPSLEAFSVGEIDEQIVFDSGPMETLSSFDNAWRRLEMLSETVR